MRSTSAVVAASGSSSAGGFHDLRRGELGKERSDIERSSCLVRDVAKDFTCEVSEHVRGERLNIGRSIERPGRTKEEQPNRCEPSGAELGDGRGVDVASLLLDEANDLGAAQEQFFGIEPSDASFDDGASERLPAAKCDS